MPHAISRPGTELARSASLDPRIERLQRRSVAQPGVLSLAGGLPAPETFPLGSLVRSFEQAGRDALQYGWPEGRRPLREQIAARLHERGMNVDANDVLVTSGAQQAIDIATGVLGGPGARVAVSSECYPAALELFRTRGLTLVTEGPAELSYMMPAVANPSGRSLSDAEICAALTPGRVILEDDAYADLRFEGPAKAPLAAQAPDLVAHIGTFSKTLSPGLRVGWLVAPARYRDAMRRAKQLTDLEANSLAQCIVERYLADEDFESHLAGLRRFYERRAEALARAVRRELPQFEFKEPEGGFSLWLTSDEPGNDADLLATALTHGVSFDPGSDFRPGGESSPLSLRLSFSSLAERAIEEAVLRLSRAFRDYARAA